MASEDLKSQLIQDLAIPARTQHTSVLDLYSRVDISLDTFPYAGTTTTCESLWMGVPVITLAGETHASRVGASLLTSVGLPELIATSLENYLCLASELAGNPARLAHLRHSLRDQMRNSPLLDAPAMARDIESTYRTIWRQWCKSRT